MPEFLQVLGIRPESWAAAKEMAASILAQQVENNASDVNENAVQYVVDWVLSNRAYFGSSVIGTCLGFTSDSGDTVYIYPSMLTQALSKAGFSARKTIKYMADRGLISEMTDKTGKMSKSKGDFLTLSLLESRGYDPRAYRFFCIQSHYRKPLEFSYETLDNTVAAYEKLVKRIGSLKKEGEGEGNLVDREKFAAYREKFAEALCDDLNTSMALTVLYDMLKEEMSDATKYALAEDFDRVLSLDLTTAYEEKKAEQGVDAETERYILEKIEERKAAKKEKNFARADEIRAELLEKGILLEDTREGVKWKKA